MGTGDPDLYKAFCWRFWNLVCEDGGRIGVVLPRSALAAKGSTEFRREVFSRAEGVDVTMLLNNKQWFFEDVHPQYTIGLVALARREAERTPVALRGPYPSLDRYTGGVVREPAVFYGDQIQSWNDTASLPLLPTDESVEVFAQLRRAPRLDLDDGESWRARPHRELDATNDKHLMDVKSKDRPPGFWPVVKGESFDLWIPDTGTYYAWADPKKVLPHLQQKRLRGGRSKNSPFSEFDQGVLRNAKTLPCLRPRIAFRDVSRATDTRTVRAALVSGEVFIGNQAANDVRPTGDRDTLFPLQAALGYSIAQTLFLGKRSVIVEGITDYWLIKALDGVMAGLGGAARLHPETVVIPTGGTSRLMPLASIMLATTGVGERKLLVLLDTDAEGIQAAARVKRELFADDESRVLMLASALGLDQATIEDLVPRQTYTNALAECGYQVELNADELKLPRNVGAIEKAFERNGLGKFTKDHRAAAALKLVDTWGKDPSTVPEETQTKAAKLFAAINARFKT